MPANLTAEAKAKWHRAQQARTPKEKIPALQEFLSAIPKHKGNERLRAQIKRKIALLRTQIETRHARGAGRASERTIQKAGAAQVVIVGLTNVGRSSLLAATTAAKPVMATYPYTTKESTPGMLQFEDLQFQLIELPALVPGEDERFVFQEGSANLVRSCDGLLVMVDLAGDPVEQLERVLAELAHWQVSPTRLESNVSFQKTRTGGVQLLGAGRLISCTRAQIESLIRSYGISNAVLRATGDVSLNDVEDAILETNLNYKPTIIVANKADLPNARENSRRLVERLGSRMPVLVTSCVTGLGLSELGKRLFEVLDLVRIYTQEPNESKPSPEPFVVKRGTTTGELSREIHSTLFRQFKYARVWGKSVSYPGERVGVDHVLVDRDVIEIHA